MVFDIFQIVLWNDQNDLFLELTCEYSKRVCNDWLIVVNGMPHCDIPKCLNFIKGSVELPFRKLYMIMIHISKSSFKLQARSFHLKINRIIHCRPLSFEMKAAVGLSWKVFKSMLQVSLNVLRLVFASCSSYA